MPIAAKRMVKEEASWGEKAGGGETDKGVERGRDKGEKEKRGEGIKEKAGGNKNKKERR